MSSNPIVIPKPPDFSFEECLWFLDRGYDDCLFSIKEGEVRKALTVGSSSVLFGVTQDKTNLIIKVFTGNVGEEGHTLLKKYVADWFDLNKDLKPFYQCLCKGPFAYMVENFYGLRLIGINDLYEALIWSIIGQQINLSFAYKLKRRLVERFGIKVLFENEEHFIFPKPEVLASTSEEELRELQFSQGKAKYIIGVSKEFTQNTLSSNLLLDLKDYESRIKLLTSIKGIGIWTANYVLMKTIRDNCAIPYGDSGLIKALKSHGIIANKNDLKSINELFENYKGWESYLVFYLWRSLSPPVFHSK